MNLKIKAKGIEPYPFKEFILLNDFWYTYGNKIEEELFNITGLKFLEDITVHLNYEYSKSYPILKLKLYKDIEDSEETLVHELIHKLLSQNENEENNKKWNTLMEEYKNETQLTRVHIAIHRIHYLLAKKLFPETLDRLINFSTHPEYIKSWDIVKTDYEKIDNILGLKML